MAYPISLVSNSSKSGKTTIALNIAILLASSNKKILLFNLKTKTPFSKLLTNVLPSNNKNIIKPLVLFQYNKNLSLMFLDNEINLKKHDWEKIISKQFSILEKKYDYIIFNVDHVGNTLVTACLNISREVFAVFNSNTFTSNDLQKILTNIRKIQISNNNIKLTTIILNNYNQHLHLESLMSVSKLTNSTYSLITLPLQNEFWEINEQSVKFIKYNKWNNYTISLSKVVEQLLKK